MTRKLKDIFKSHQGRRTYKVEHYFDLYDRHVSKFIDTDVCVLEVGVNKGGSLQLWKEYFGSKARIYGIDNNPRCKRYEEDRIKIFIGDQEDVEFLAFVAADLPKIDILIDDGGHVMQQQITTFRTLFPEIHEEGVYVCEDTLTSYSKKYRGDSEKTFVNYMKDLTDLQMNEDEMMFGIHFYPWILIIEKQRIGKMHKIFGGKKNAR